MEVFENIERRNERATPLNAESIMTLLVLRTHPIFAMTNSL